MPLEQRRLELDPCEVYKYISGQNMNNPEHLLSMFQQHEGPRLKAEEDVRSY